LPCGKRNGFAVKCSFEREMRTAHKANFISCHEVTFHDAEHHFTFRSSKHFIFNLNVQVRHRFGAKLCSKINFK